MSPDSVPDDATRQALIDLQADTKQTEADLRALVSDLQQTIEALAARVAALEA